MARNDVSKFRDGWAHFRNWVVKGLKFNRLMFQMINGGPLPKFEIHTPSSSFDAQGRFNSAVELPGKSILKLFSYHDFFFLILSSTGWAL